MRQSAELDLLSYHQPDSGFYHRWSQNIESVIAVGALCSALAVLVCCYQKQSTRRQHMSCDASYTRLDNINGVRGDEDGNEDDERMFAGNQPALSHCLEYLKTAAGAGYRLVRALPAIGTRPDKHWFIVREARRDVQRLLVMSLLPPSDLLPSHATASNLLTVLHHTAHPYIHPVLHVGIHHGYLITVVPINTAGSLRDVLYRGSVSASSNWSRSAVNKYRTGTRPVRLPLPQVQRLARQLLEALVWLRQRGLPAATHAHAGNVIVQGGVARLAAIENILVHMPSQIPGITHVPPNTADTLCFAHLLFEMATGYRLNAARPSPGQLLDLHTYPQVLDVMEVIFGNADGSLSPIERLLTCELFRNIDLRELQDLAQSTRVISKESQLSGGALALLREVHGDYQFDKKATNNINSNYDQRNTDDRDSQC